MNKLITLLALLLISTMAFAQDKPKKKELKIGQSWESYYKTDTPMYTMVIEELCYYFCRHPDTSYRVYSVTIKGDTADITIDKLPEITKKAKVIRIGDRLYVPIESVIFKDLPILPDPWNGKEPLFKIGWNYFNRKTSTDE